MSEADTAATERELLIDLHNRGQTIFNFISIPRTRTNRVRAQLFLIFLHHIIFSCPFFYSRPPRLPHPSLSARDHFNSIFKIRSAQYQFVIQRIPYLMQCVIVDMLSKQFTDYTTAYSFSFLKEVLHIF